MTDNPWARLTARFRRSCRSLARKLEYSLVEDAPSTSLHGITVVDTSWDSHKDSEKHFATIQRGLDWIHRHEPRRVERIRSSIDRIIVDDLPGRRGEYRHELKAAVVATETVLGGAQEVALTIIHESTHGRLMRAGFSYPQERRAQIERICNKRVVSFLRIADPGGDRLQETVARLDEPGMDDLKLWLSEERKRFGSLERAGLPRWVMGLLQRWESVRRRRAIKAYGSTEAPKANAPDDAERNRP